MTKTSGFREWAKYSENIQIGCKHQCSYCYALGMSKRRKGQSSYRANLEEWGNNCVIRQDKLKKGFRKRNGTIGFPTTHDIYDENYHECRDQLKKMLRVGNDVLITTKPHYNIITLLCEELKEWKDQILFRFTIGSADSNVLKFFEPNAPDYKERAMAVKHAYKMGFSTSLSMEPFLDEMPYLVIQQLEPYITDTIWLGLLNERWVPKDIKKQIKEHENPKIKKVFTYKNIQFMENLISMCQLFSNSKLRLKDSIQNLLGCEQLK